MRILSQGKKNPPSEPANGGAKWGREISKVKITFSLRLEVRFFRLLLPCKRLEECP